MHIIESSAQLTALYERYSIVGGFAHNANMSSFTFWSYDQDGNMLTVVTQIGEQIRYTETPYADRDKETIVFEYHAPQEER